MEKSLLFIGAGGHALVLVDALRDKFVNILGALAKDSGGGGQRSVSETPDNRC